jgi:hypothetical protein
MLNFLAHSPSLIASTSAEATEDFFRKIPAEYAKQDWEILAAKMRKTEAEFLP